MLADPGVSRQHARLERVGGALKLVDPGSANGVFVGSKRVKEAMLASGQVIRIATFSIECWIEGQAAEAQKTLIADAATPRRPATARRRRQRRLPRPGRPRPSARSSSGQPAAGPARRQRSHQPWSRATHRHLPPARPLRLPSLAAPPTERRRPGRAARSAASDPAAGSAASPAPAARARRRPRQP